MASSLHLTAAISVGVALIPAGLAELRVAVAPAVPAKPGGAFQHLAVLPDAAGSLTYVGGGNGHAVAVMQPDYSNSDDPSSAPSSLVEIAPGKAPRTIATFNGGAAMPSVGTDAAGRVVVVVRPCAAFTEDDAPRRCDLASFDLETGKRTTLAGTHDAVVGDVDHGQLVTVGARTTVSVGGPASTPPSTAQPMPLGDLISAKTGGEATAGDVDAIDLEDGRIALTTIAPTESGSDSLLLTAPVGGSWTTLGVNGTGGAAQGSRNYDGPQVTATGVRAYLDGAGDFTSYAQRWSLDGVLVSKRAGSAIGSASWVTSAAFVGDTLFTAPTPECDEHCQVEAAGPVRLG